MNNPRPTISRIFQRCCVLGFINACPSWSPRTVAKQDAGQFLVFGRLFALARPGLAQAGFGLAPPPGIEDEAGLPDASLRNYGEPKTNRKLGRICGLVILAGMPKPIVQGWQTGTGEIYKIKHWFNRQVAVLGRWMHSIRPCISPFGQWSCANRLSCRFVRHTCQYDGLT